MIHSTLETSKFPTKNQLSDLKEQLKKKGMATDNTLDMFENNLALVDIYYRTMAIEVNSFLATYSTPMGAVYILGGRDD